MQDLPLTVEDIQAHLQGIDDFKPAVIKRFFDADSGPEGRLFFLIEYEAGELVMARGEYSDYVAVHLQGLVRVCDLERPRVRLPECWDNPRPWRRRLAALPVVGRLLARLFPVRYGEGQISGPADADLGDLRLSRADLNKITRVVSVRDAQTGDKKPLIDRLLGVPSVLLKQQRTRTLVADNDNGEACRMLLIKRRALMELLFTGYQKPNTPVMPTKFYQAHIHALLEQTLPDVLSKNRLFRPMLYVEDVLDWDGLTALFRDDSKTVRVPAALRSLLRQQLQVPLPAGNLEDADKYQVICALNGVLAGADLFATQSWAADLLDEPTRSRLRKEPAPATPNQCYLRNRLILEAALPGKFVGIADFSLVRAEDFRGEFLQLLRSQGTVLLPQYTDKGQTIFQAGQDADALFFILQGKYRVTRKGAGGTLIFNHLSEDGFFGEACAMEDAQGQPLKRSAGVEALSRGVLLRLERPLILKLCERYPEFRERLLREGHRSVRRDAARQAGRRIPPQEPPLEIATRLQVTTNLLVIDMDRCTRCDQCVKACATAHEDRPRFHRANPDLRFGKWEVAGVCLHCSDAPCLEECPVGAITFLEDGAVQIHRNRCIGCTKCASACPFGVIDMYEPAKDNPLDRASLAKSKSAVATKCDLCLTDSRDPPCVAACPYGAAQRGKPEEFFPGLRGWAQLTDPE